MVRFTFGLGGIVFLGVPQEYLGNWWLMSDEAMTDVALTLENSDACSFASYGIRNYFN